LIVFLTLPLHLIADESPQLVEIERPSAAEFARTWQLAARRHGLNAALAEPEDGGGVFARTTHDLQHTRARAGQITAPAQSFGQRREAGAALTANASRK
jgi:hypothetical protein